MKLKELPKSIYHSLRLKMISKKAICSKGETIPVIVSLTTIPSRLHKVDITIRSILTQTQQPEKIVLWIPEDIAGKIPDALSELTGDIFEICFSPLTSSHKKLVHSIERFPNKIIVTCDDDFIYHKSWLALLYKEHLEHPGVIIANQTRMIKYQKDGSLKPYKEWVYDTTQPYNSKEILPIGAEGVLYPPNALHPTVTNSRLFLELAPKADDLWFKAMALLNNTESVLARNRPPQGIPILGTQGVSLKKENISEGKNVKQWAALKKHFRI